MKFKKLIKSDENDYTTVTNKGYKYEQLSDEAKSNVRSWLNGDNLYWEDYFQEDLASFINEKLKSYNATSNDLKIDWDGYDRCTIDLKKGRSYWPAFDTILVDCAKQVLKDLPTFKEDPTLLEDWAREAASDMYYSGGYFETYSGLNDIDGYDGYGLSYKISDLCTEAYEEKIKPILEDVSRDCTNFAEKQEEYFYSDEYAKETCDANEYLFDEDGNIL